MIRRNFRSRRGEIDVVALRGDQLVFAEVKSWDVLHSEDLEYAINARKQRRIIETSKLFMVRNPQLADLRLRYDLLFFSEDRGADPLHIENAF